MTKNHFTLSKYRTPIFLVLALLVLYVISRYNYLLFHSLADGVSIVIAACVFAIIWNRRHIVDNDYFLYVGIAFLFFAFWDLLHLLGNKNMGVFPQYGNLGPALYIVSRYILAISLLIAPLFINRKLNTTLMYTAYSLVTLLILLSIFSWQIFPVCIVEGVGLTPFKVVSDYIICLILLGAIGLLLINRRSFDSRVLRLIVSSIILSIATGMAFTLYADPFGIMNAIGHFFQIASFYLIYLAFIETSLKKPQDILYQKLKQNERKLTEYVDQLNDANDDLKQEITSRKLAEEKIKSSLLEKETMLKEIHHRVKNNLQVISSLLSLQSSYLQDEKAREMLQNSMDRVKVMAKIHTMLYQSEDLARVDFGGFIKDLAGRVQQSYGSAESPVAVHVNVSDVSLTIETSIPCGLILNELVSNAFKHAFQKGRGGEIHISMATAGEQFVLKVRDNGIGFPASVDFQNTKSLGLELVNLLVGQMNGKIDMQVDGGTTFTITFPAVSKGG